jgi:hypothetical protein
MSAAAAQGAMRSARTSRVSASFTELVQHRCEAQRPNCCTRGLALLPPLAGLELMKTRSQLSFDGSRVMGIGVACSSDSSR